MMKEQEHGESVIQLYEKHQKHHAGTQHEIADGQGRGGGTTENLQLPEEQEGEVPTEGGVHSKRRHLSRHHQN